MAISTHPRTLAHVYHASCRCHRFIDGKETVYTDCNRSISCLTILRTEKLQFVGNRCRMCAPHWNHQRCRAQHGVTVAMFNPTVAGLHCLRAEVWCRVSYCGGPNKYCLRCMEVLQLYHAYTPLSLSLHSHPRTHARIRLQIGFADHTRTLTASPRFTLQVSGTHTNTTLSLRLLDASASDTRHLPPRTQTNPHTSRTHTCSFDERLSHGVMVKNRCSTTITTMLSHPPVVTNIKHLNRSPHSPQR